MSTYNDPNTNRPPNVERRAAAESWSTNSIILGSLAALALVFGIYYMISHRNPTVATPAVTTNAPVTNPTTVPTQPRPSETTGSGSTTVTPPPAAPSSAPATTR
jgi:hypothetical protein